MKIKSKHVVRYMKMLTETSAFSMVKEFQVKGDRPLNGFTTYLDTLWCKLRYGMTVKEYFYFGFYNKSGYARKSFLSSAEHTWRTAYMINNGDKSLFEEKINAYHAFKPFYRREAVALTLPADVDKMQVFAQRHGGFILKPHGSSQGQGICFWKKDMDHADSLLKQIGESHWGGVILEELIRQDSEMASFHPTSINTIRYVVDYRKDTVDRLWAIIRIGVGDSKVDNTSAGGICAAIDLETGVIVSKGVRRDGGCYLFHPDTGKQILGETIPKWNELNDMIDMLRPVGTPVHLVGWDFALSEKGWCIVEGNACPSIMGIQGSMDMGYRKVMKRVRENMSKV